MVHVVMLRSQPLDTPRGAAFLAGGLSGLVVGVGLVAISRWMEPSLAPALEALWLIWCAAGVRNAEKIINFLTGPGRSHFVARVALEPSLATAFPWLVDNARKRFVGSTAAWQARSTRITLLAAITVYAVVRIGWQAAFFAVVVLLLSHIMQVVVSVLLVIESWFRTHHIPSAPAWLPEVYKHQEMDILE